MTTNDSRSSRKWRKRPVVIEAVQFTESDPLFADDTGEDTNVEDSYGR